MDLSNSFNFMEGSVLSNENFSTFKLLYMNFKLLMPKYKKRPPTSYDFRFTVFTPVFNCEKSIQRVHDCLLDQTFKNFEWLIINDGSTDNSHEKIMTIIENTSININYINNTNNKHKMSCFIQSIESARGEFLLPLDGDDECRSDALSIFNKEYDNIPKDLKEEVAAVSVLCNDQYGNLVGKLFPDNPFYCNTFEAVIRKQIIGEKWGFTKTDVLKGIIINPEMLRFGGFIPESVIWNTVSNNGFLTKCVNKPLRIYHLDVENSISKTSTPKNDFGMVLSGIVIQNLFFNTYFYISPIFFFKNLYITIRSSNSLEYNLKNYLKSLDPYFVKILWISFWPFRKFMK